MNLNSKTIGNVLVTFLWINIILNGIGLITTYLYVYHYNIFLNFVTLDQIVSIFLLIIYFITIILYLTWLYKVHVDLKHLLIDYPITPGGAMMRIIIPFYNIWGMWNVYSTMGRQLQPKSNTELLAIRLSNCIPFYYILTLISRGISSGLTRNPSEGILLTAYIVDQFLFIFYLVMVVIITKAIKILSGTSEVDSATGTMSQH